MQQQIGAQIAGSEVKLGVKPQGKVWGRPSGQVMGQLWGVKSGVRLGVTSDVNSFASTNSKSNSGLNFGVSQLPVQLSLCTNANLPVCPCVCLSVLARAVCPPPVHPPGLLVGAAILGRV